MRAFVAGATGYTGSALVAQLRQLGATVVAHIRPESSRRVAFEQEFAALGAQLEIVPWEPAELEGSLRRHQVDVVFCLIGTTRTQAKREGIDVRTRFSHVDQRLSLMLLEAAVAAVPDAHFVYLSAVGSSASASNPYQRTRGIVEQRIQSSLLRYTIARPSFISGSRTERRAGEHTLVALTDGLLGGLARLGLKNPYERYRSIDSQTLARALINAATRSVHPNQILESHELQALGRLKPAPLTLGHGG